MAKTGYMRVSKNDQKADLQQKSLICSNCEQVLKWKLTRSEEIFIIKSARWVEHIFIFDTVPLLIKAVARNLPTLHNKYTVSWLKKQFLNLN